MSVLIDQSQFKTADADGPTRNPHQVPPFDELNSPEHERKLVEAWTPGERQPPVNPPPISAAAKAYRFVVGACRQQSPAILQFQDPSTPPPCLSKAEVWRLVGTLCRDEGEPLRVALAKVLAPAMVDAAVAVFREGRR